MENTAHNCLPAYSIAFQWKFDFRNELSIGVQLLRALTAVVYNAVCKCRFDHWPSSKDFFQRKKYIRIQLGITTPFVYVCPPGAYTIQTIWRACFAFKQHYRSIAVFPLSCFFFKGAFKSPIKALIHLTLRVVYRVVYRDRESGVLRFYTDPILVPRGRDPSGLRHWAFGFSRFFHFRFTS